MFRTDLNDTGVFVFFLIVAVLVVTVPLYVRAECKDVVWESAEYNDLLNKGWGPIVMYNVAPPPGTKHQLCSGWKDSLSTIPTLLSPEPPETSGSTPVGTRPATAADIPKMESAGIPDPQVGMPWNTKDPNTGQAAGEAKLWLRQHATKDANISCLNTQFAEKLKKFMEAVPGGPPKITDAYRGPEKQNGLVASRASKAGPCQSYHNYGLAADFNANKALLPWMHANAGRSGLRTITGVNGWDPGHFQNAEGRHGQCGACNSGGSGNGFLPAPERGSPSSGLADQIRQALGMQPPPPPPPPLPPPQMQQPQMQQQLPQQPQSSAQPILPAQSSISSEALGTQSSIANLLTPANSSQNSLLNLLTATSTTTGEPLALNLNSNDGSRTATSSLSAFDLIRQFENQMDPVNQPIMTTTTPLSLNNDLLNSVELQAVTGTDVSSSVDTAGNSDVTAQNPNTLASAPPARPIIMAPPISQQTFTSPDLAGNPVPVNATKQNGALIQILEIFKNVLLYALNYLRSVRPYGSAQTQVLAL